MCGNAGEGKIFLVTSDSLGNNQEIGKLLMSSFFQNLAEGDCGVEMVLLINNGVLLATEGSEMIESLQKLSDKGAAVVLCGTCVDYFDIKDKIKVGRIGKMASLINSILSPLQVVTVG